MSFFITKNEEKFGLGKIDKKTLNQIVLALVNLGAIKVRSKVLCLV
jgi:hypothetical protein